MPITTYTKDDFPLGRRIKSGNATYTVKSAQFDIIRNELTVTVINLSTGNTIVYYPNSAGVAQFLPYEREDFPVGTVVSVRGTHYTVREVVNHHYDGFGLHFKETRDLVVRPRKPETIFEHIVSRPDLTPDTPAKADADDIKIGDRIKVTPHIPGITGEGFGTVYYLQGNKVFAHMEPDGKNQYFIRDTDVYTVEKVVPSFQERLNALPVRTIIDGKGDNKDLFAVKLSPKRWAISHMDTITYRFTNEDWILPE